jgi:hypothetical protein
LIVPWGPTHGDQSHLGLRSIPSIVKWVRHIAPIFVNIATRGTSSRPVRTDKTGGDSRREVGLIAEMDLLFSCIM